MPPAPDLDPVRTALGEAEQARDPLAVVRHLAHAHALLEATLDEAMARSVLAGASVRTVAAQAGLAPNSVPPRLATTDSLSAYSAATGRVQAEGIARARFDAERGLPAPAPAPATGAAASEPLRFRRRRS